MTCPTAAGDFYLMDYIYLLWRWAWLIALLAILAGGAAYYTSSRTTPVYQTTTLLLVSDPSGMSSINSTSWSQPMIWQIPTPRC